MLDVNSSAKEPAIGLRKAKTGAGYTRFGGHPNLSEHIPWPHDRAGRPMHHVLQLDCGALPFLDPDLPRAGTLMFFITASYDESNAPDIMETERGGCAVIYQEATPAETPERKHPETCPALGEYSFAMRPVRYPVAKKKVSLLKRILSTQPKPYSGSGGTGFFDPVPLDATVFDSFPKSDPQNAIAALQSDDAEADENDFIRAFQLMGYAPRLSDLSEAQAQGHTTGSEEKALAAYEKARGRDDILLVQFAHDPSLNFDLFREKFALQFRIKRADLRARAFDQATIHVEKHGLDGVWWFPKDTTPSYAPAAKELTPQIALKLLTPFETPSAPGNYFGGAPQLPAGMAWPCASNGHPLGFLMQIDCASLPRGADAGGETLALPEFPMTGTMFVFAYDFLEDLNSESFQILYTPDDISHLPARSFPEALATLPEYAGQNIRVRAGYGEVARPDPKRPFEPIGFKTISTPSGGDPDYEAKHDFVSEYGGALPHEDKAYPGAELLVDWLPNYKAAYFGEDGPSENSYNINPIRSIPLSYPWRWGDIRTATEVFPHDEHQHVKTEDRDAIFGKDLIAEGEQWKEKSNACDPLGRISDDDRAAYQQWLLRMDACSEGLPVEAPKESNSEHRQRRKLEQGFEGIMRRLARPYPHFGYGSLPDSFYYLSYDPDADDFPEEMKEIVAEMVRFQRSDTQLNGYNTYHKPDPDIMFGSDAEEQRNDTEILLFSLASGTGLPVNWYDCARLYVWIEAQDLAEQRFDRIRITFKL